MSDWKKRAKDVTHEYLPSSDVLVSPESTSEDDKLKQFANYLDTTKGKGIVEDPNAKVQDTTALDAYLGHTAQAGTFGLSDELTGGIEGLGRAIGLKGLGYNPEHGISGVKAAEGGPTLSWDQIKQAYNEGRQGERGFLNKSSEEHPTASMAGTATGIATTLPMTGAFGGAAKVATGGETAAELLALRNAQLVASSKAGAGMGALAGFGSSEADIANQGLKAIPEAAIDTAKGAAYGATLPLAITGMGAAVKGTGKAIANSNIVKGFKRGVAAPDIDVDVTPVAQRTLDFGKKILGSVDEETAALANKKVQLVKESGEMVNLNNPRSEMEDLLKRYKESHAKLPEAVEKANYIQDRLGKLMGDTEEQKLIQAGWDKKAVPEIEAKPYVLSAKEKIEEQFVRENEAARAVGSTPSNKYIVTSKDGKLLTPVRPDTLGNTDTLKAPHASIPNTPAIPAEPMIPGRTDITPKMEKVTTTNRNIQPQTVQNADQIREVLSTMVDETTDNTFKELQSGLTKLRNKVSEDINLSSTEIAEANNSLQEINKAMDDLKVGTDFGANSADYAGNLSREEQVASKIYQAGGEGLPAREAATRIKNAITKLETINPKLADEFRSQVAELTGDISLAKLSAAGTPLGNRAIIRAIVTKFANPAGRILGTVDRELGNVPGKVIKGIYNPIQSGVAAGAKFGSKIAPQEIIQKAPTTVPDDAPFSPQSTNPGKQSRYMYDLPDNELKQEVSKLAQNPRYKQAVEYLNEAIDTGNLQKKNAVLFRLMQDPAARKELRGE